MSSCSDVATGVNVPPTYPRPRQVPSTHQSHHLSPLHSFIPGLNLPSANPSHRSLPFLLPTDSTDSPDCLPILLTISVFSFSVFHFLVDDSVLSINPSFSPLAPDPTA